MSITECFLTVKKEKMVSFLVNDRQHIKSDLHLQATGGLSFSAGNGTVRPPPTVFVIRLTPLLDESCWEIPEVVNETCLRVLTPEEAGRSGGFPYRNWDLVIDIMKLVHCKK